MVNSYFHIWNMGIPIKLKTDLGVTIFCGVYCIWLRKIYIISLIGYNFIFYLRKILYLTEKKYSIYFDLYAWLKKNTIFDWEKDSIYFDLIKSIYDLRKILIHCDLKKKIHNSVLFNKKISLT